MFLAERDDVFSRDAGAFFDFDKRARCLSPFWIRLGHDGNRQNGGMPVEHILDFDGGYVFATGDDDVLASILDFDIAIRVLNSEVA